eukprot:Skav234232  [mRNA]  locus=scaffold1464:328413:336180:- [translate_table: standard]
MAIGLAMATNSPSLMPSKPLNLCKVSARDRLTEDTLALYFSASLARLLNSSLALSEIALSASHAKSFRSGEPARSGNHFNTSSVVRYIGGILAQICSSIGPMLRHFFWRLDGSQQTAPSLSRFKASMAIVTRAGSLGGITSK